MKEHDSSITYSASTRLEAGDPHPVGSESGRVHTKLKREKKGGWILDRGG